MDKPVPEKTVERLSVYRRALHQLRADGVEVVFSKDLAGLVNGKAHQVRRDLMAAGCTGVPNGGYSVRSLLTGIAQFLDGVRSPGVCLVGVGRLGQALLSYFSGRWRWLGITACFDNDPAKIGRTISNCQCYAMSEMQQVVREMGIGIGVIAVPSEQAQPAAQQLVEAGVTGLLNFAPARLRLPETVHVENVDLTMTLEKVAYFARMKQEETRGTAGV